MEGKRNAEKVEDILLDVCDFHVIDRPLSKGQLALCDFGRQTVSVNSEMSRFVHHKTDLQALRWSTLAHELGHIRLHLEEMTEGCFISYYPGTRQFADGRSYQKEREADMYSNVFLIPKTELLGERQVQSILNHRTAGKELGSGTLWKYVYQLAQTFKVTPTLMKRCLQELGWLEQGPRGPSGLNKLTLNYKERRG
jgi:hypothetical protein